MGDEAFRDRWVSEVIRTPLITDAVRVTLLVLAPEMDEAGEVSVPRKELAERLGRTERKVGDRIKAAIEGGFLVLVTRGQKHRHAVYRATLDALSRTPGGHAEDDPQGTPGPYPEDSQQDGFKHPEPNPQQAPRGASREILSRPPGGDPEISRPYKDHAPAHSNGDLAVVPADLIGNDDGAIVIGLFNKEIAPSLRSQKQTPTRERAGATEDPGFGEFWDTYPRKIGKGAARKAWAKALRSGADPEQITLGARRFATDPRRSQADIKYTPHPATWLNAERWDDEPEPDYVPAPVVDRRQQTTNDQFDRAMERARRMDALEAHGEP